MTTEIITMFTPAISEMWMHMGSFGFAIDNDSGTIAMRSRCSNDGSGGSHFISFYAPGQDPKFVVVPVPHTHEVIDICVVKTIVFVSTLFSFGRVDFAVEEPSYAIYFNLARQIDSYLV